MIIFDLDGTLADCEHRRHFVDRDKAAEMGICYEEDVITFGGWQNGPWVLTSDPDRLWKPDWRSFYESCSEDKPIDLVIEMLLCFHSNDHEIQIWSGRCESVREKTIDWIGKYIPIWNDEISLKMRPIGDSIPDDQLKERWLNERCADLIEAQIEDRIPVKHDIDFVVDDRSKVVRMWRRRGIFVFDVNQSGKEF